MKWFELSDDNIKTVLTAALKRNELIEESMKDAKDNAKRTKCLFRPLKIGAEKCNFEMVTLYGYCQSHKSSVQGKNARLQMEEIEKKSTPTTAVAVVQPPPQPIAAVTQPKIINAPLVKEKSRNVIDEPRSVESESDEDIESEGESQDEEPPHRQESRNVKREDSKQLNTHKKSKSSHRERSERGEPKQSSDKIIRIRRNEFGNFEDSKTNIVFDSITRSAYGIQRRNGDVYSLGKEQVEICIKNGWMYTLPEVKYAYYDSEDNIEDVVSAGESEDDISSEEEHPVREIKKSQRKRS